MLRSWLLISFSNFYKSGLTGEMTNLRTGAENIYMLSLEHLVVPENKEEFRQLCKDCGMSKGHSSQLKELLMAKDETI